MKAEFDAFKTRLEAHPKLAGKVSIGARKDAPVRANYVVLFPRLPSNMDDERYTARRSAQSKRLMSFDVRYVSVDGAGWMVLAEAAREQMDGVVLDVAGRVCDPIEIAGDRVEEAEGAYDKTADLFYADDTFEFWSRRP